MQFIHSHQRVRGVLFALSILAVAASAAAEPLRIRFENGIDATIFSSEELLESRIQRDGGNTRLVVDSQLQYDLVTDITDPMFTNRGDGQFHPMPVEAIVAAIEAIHLENADLSLEVYVLPYPRRAILDSSAREGRIFLSPGVRPVSDYAAHFTITHEVGHAYQYRWMPDRDQLAWEQYAALRGIQDARTYHASGAHKNRPHEIFAEDFRFLFGGTTANYSGGIENDDLALPSDLVALRPFVAGRCEPRLAGTPLARVMTTPNPFNPSTEIRVDFAAAPTSPALLRVFDAQGREVRRLFAARPAGRLLRVAWDGRTDGGSAVASGVYFARLDYRNEQFATKLLLVR